uniref:C->U-editing enzyme APOBEC-4 n=1 Tax=Geotrypetes seraphini TaxID=260995 RepID=A0A6P8P747_GEOSA|nr:putative C->U-editing enzyme APOBEC-4 [Geotrypetes seraphini]XP_033771317.1 putative C->U-editing enzyme APOBEC-4 [Geotrypetes seraphini]XP_033771318.1 putative C->U-editing enzyme APOBEC-4 [Geotrypetes seraphini]
MENIYQEYLATQGTVVKPYYWLTPNQGCSRCPYHIQTGEEARISYAEFYRTFGFPYGPILVPKQHLLFYELKTFSGTSVQKGHATNCVVFDLHPESMLFETGGYLDSSVCHYENIGYLTLYSNYSPCNEYGHCCISKIYDFLGKYPSIRLDIYFSQLYHTTHEFPTAPWNREALRSLASLWPRVSLNPLSGSFWQALLYSFVKNVPAASLYQPIMPARALADRSNVQQIQAITGIAPYFVDVSSETSYPIQEPYKTVPQQSMDNNFLQQHSRGVSNGLIPVIALGPPVPFLTMFAPSYGLQQQSYSKPRNIVRHLKMPEELKEERKRILPKETAVQTVQITKEFVKEDKKDRRKK